MVIARFAIAVAAISLAVCACSRTDNCDVDDLAIQELRENRKFWYELAPSDYDLKFRIVCNCEIHGNYLLRVKDAHASIVQLPLSSTVDNSYLLEQLSIDRLFDEIERNLAQEMSNTKVIYDPDSFYPAAVMIDRNTQIDDDEVWYFIEIQEPANERVQLPDSAVTPRAEHGSRQPAGS